ALEVRADGTASGSTERRLILAGASRGRAGGPGAGDRYALMTALSQVRSSASYDFARRPAQYAKSGRQIGLRWRRAPPLPCLPAGGWAGRRCSAQHLGELGARAPPPGPLGGKIATALRQLGSSTYRRRAPTQ